MALNITKGVVFKAQKVIIYGPEGIGKSSFAAKFPQPLFIDTEGSTNLLDVARLPRPTSWTMMMQMINEVKKTPDCCKTLIIDTIDWAEQMCVAHICSTYQKKGIEEFGYGKGYVYVKEEFGRLLNLLQDIVDTGINIVLTAHAQLKKFEQPNEAGSYDRYELKLGSKSSSQTSPLIKEWADLVLFANYKTFVVTVDNKKKAQGGERIMYTSHHPCWDAKNRHDLKPELPFDYTQIAYCIPNNTDAPPKEKVEKEQIVNETIKAAFAEKDVVHHEAEKQPIQPPPQTQSPESKGIAASPESAATAKPPVTTAAPSPKNIPKALADLMAANHVTVYEIQECVAMKGYYPQDTPIANYDPSFIDGVLVGAWPQVFMAIQLERENIPF